MNYLERKRNIFKMSDNAFDNYVADSLGLTYGSSISGCDDGVEQNFATEAIFGTLFVFVAYISIGALLAMVLIGLISNICNINEAMTDKLFIAVLLSEWIVLPFLYLHYILTGMNADLHWQTASNISNILFRKLFKDMQKEKDFFIFQYDLFPLGTINNDVIITEKYWLNTLHIDKSNVFNQSPAFQTGGTITHGNILN